MQNIIELKAKAYDLLAQIDYLQNELKKTNEAILKAMQEQQAKEPPQENV